VLHCEQVETLGDKVYMVAGGVPDRRADHADCVAAVALEFRTKVTQINVPDTDQLLIRIGMQLFMIPASMVTFPAAIHPRRLAIGRSLAEDIWGHMATTGAQAYNEGLESVPPAGSLAEPLVRLSGGEASLKLKAFITIIFPTESENLTFVSDFLICCYYFMVASLSEV